VGKMRWRLDQQQRAPAANDDGRRGGKEGEDVEGPNVRHRGEHTRPRAKLRDDWYDDASSLTRDVNVLSNYMPRRLAEEVKLILEGED
jgi:hypothetical protein